MPVYTYSCKENGQIVEVSHMMSAKLKSWGEPCYVAQIPLGKTDPMTPVERIMRVAQGVSVPVFNSELKNSGFTKLVKRDKGVYESRRQGLSSLLQQKIKD